MPKDHKLREDQKSRIRAQINANLRKALESPASPMTSQDWEAIRREGKKRAESRKKKQCA